MRPINPLTRFDVNVRQAFKWPLLQFDVNVCPAVSLISKAHKYETSNANMKRFALACCEKNGLSVRVSINNDLPPAVPVSISIDAWPHSYHGWPFNEFWYWYWRKTGRNPTRRIGKVSSKFVWENIDSSPASRETFCIVWELLRPMDDKHRVHCCKLTRVSTATDKQRVHCYTRSHSDG
jgi:hypothetical protein